MSSAIGIAGLVAVGTAAAGAGATMYAANKNSKAIKDANSANAQNVEDTNKYNYAMWKESRGIASDGSALNTKMPQWMAVRTGGTPTTARQLVRKGATTSPTVSGGLTTGLYANTAASPYGAYKPSGYWDSTSDTADTEATAEAKKGGLSLLGKNSNDISNKNKVKNFALMGAGVAAPFFNKNDKRSAVKKVLDPIGIFG